MINAWETLAPTKSFGGMTLAQFKALADPAFTARQHIADLESQMTQAINDRDAADAAALGQAQLVVAGVLADPTEGKNSSVYEAMGYVRQGERRSGLTRAKKGTGSSKPS
jgi:hypothetical protein